MFKWPLYQIGCFLVHALLQIILFLLRQQQKIKYYLSSFIQRTRENSVL